MGCITKAVVSPQPFSMKLGDVDDICEINVAAATKAEDDVLTNPSFVGMFKSRVSV